MNQKVTLRIVVGLAVVVALIAGWIWFDNWSKDPENEAAAQTEGMVAALQVDGLNARAVIFTSDGEKKTSPDVQKGEDDREVSWGSTGAHLFVSSNRGGGAYNIYRWNPNNGHFSRRSRGSRSQGAPWFIPDGSVDSLRNGLMVAGGTVQVLDPKLILQRQILPPLAMDADPEGEGGVVGPMSGAYRDLGESFREARWGPKKEVIYSVMRREGGEVLVVSPQVAATEGGQVPPPVPVAAGKRISIDADASGRLVALIQEFQWPDPNNIPEQFQKNGKITYPYRDGLFVIPPPSEGQQTGLLPVVIFPETEGIFGTELALSPDGSRVAVVMKKRDGDNTEPLGLFSFAAEPNGAEKGGGMVQGPVSSPSWSPDSKKVVYLRLVDGKNLVYLFDTTSNLEKRVSDTEANYRSPRFSPHQSGG